MRALERLRRLAQKACQVRVVAGQQQFSAALPASRTGPLRSAAETVIRPSTRAVAMPALVREEQVLAVETDAFGAISVVAEGEGDVENNTEYRNVDGYRVEDGRYAAFMAEISDFIPSARQFTDPVRTFAYGTDASFYRCGSSLSPLSSETLPACPGLRVFRSNQRCCCAPRGALGRLVGVRGLLVGPTTTLCHAG
jgi:hypothetical protein